jgi:hypothetical protein
MLEIKSIIVVILSGLYTSLWGAFKDSPYEDFKPKTFPRSVYFSIVVWVTYLWLATVWGPLREQWAALNSVQLFFFIMGVERCMTEIYKAFFRFEDQSKYFVPSRFTLLGRPVKSEVFRFSMGIASTVAVFGLTLVPVKIESFVAFLTVAYLSGLFVSFGGAYKDAPFEGFAPLKFQRSGLVLAVTSPFFWALGPMSIGLLVLMNGGLERFTVEYYKTYIKRNMSGKFRPDLKIYTHRKATREKFHILAWVIIVLVVIEYVGILRRG